MVAWSWTIKVLSFPTFGKLKTYMCLDRRKVTPWIIWIRSWKKLDIVNITVLLLQKRLKFNFNRETSAGPDQLKLADLIALTVEKIAIILTKWWGTCIPNSVKQCWTTLIPKTVDELKDPSNWCPIIISNLFIQLYVKIWDKRLRKNIHLDDRQKGFVPVDGCFKNVKVLQQLIKLQRLKKKEYSIVFIDLAKAWILFHN